MGDGGLFYNMLFVTAASQIEGGERGQNAGKTGFSEPSPGQPGEGRRPSLCFKVSRVRGKATYSTVVLLFTAVWLCVVCYWCRKMFVFDPCIEHLSQFMEFLCNNLPSGAANFSICLRVMFWPPICLRGMYPQIMLSLTLILSNCVCVCLCVSTVSAHLHHLHCVGTWPLLCATGCFVVLEMSHKHISNILNPNLRPVSIHLYVYLW